jgi:ea8.5-like protein
MKASVLVYDSFSNFCKTEFIGARNGAMKRELEKREDDYNWARQFLCEAGALEECEIHDGTFCRGDEDITNAYKLLNAQVTADKIQLEPGQTRRDLTDLLLEVYEDNAGADRCMECEENFGSD